MKRKNLVLYSHDFYPSSGVSSIRINHWAKNLKKYLPDELHLKVITNNQKAEIVSGVDEIKILPKIKHGVLGKLINTYELIKEVRKARTSSVFLITGGPFYSFLSIFFIPKNFPVIIDLRDPFANNPRHKSSFFKGITKKAFQRSFMHRADMLIFINKSLEKSFRAKSGKEVSIIPNGFDSFKFSRSASNTKVVVMGKVYSDLTGIILELTKQVPEIEFHQYIETQSAGKAHLLPNLKNVYFHDPVSPDQAVEVCKKYGLGLVSSFREDYVLPVKTFTYIQAGLKIIVLDDAKSSETELRRLLENYKGSLFLDSKDLDLKTISRFLEQENTLSKIEDFSKHYYRDKSTEILANQLKKFLI